MAKKKIRAGELLEQLNASPEFVARQAAAERETILNSQKKST